MIYFLDTNAVSDVLLKRSGVEERFVYHIRQGSRLAICDAVHFELERGFLHRNATRKRQAFRTGILPLLEWIEIEPEDWLQAADFWAQMTRQGRQLSDIDLLLAAMVYRRPARLVTNDGDFDHLPVTSENWRQ